ncbi:HAD-IA family hydrolase [Algicella marina]|uniref:phosphoglycolate phosphatase n=1 Tax=Algicella marina TaxID=2683284 RepID=A0A6P1T182_9RHOB|nr:HAD-IA family hydrolase [Algicella marina]QHQ34292.1 HAD-IA family hydrolase [Algicella marina]
MARLIFDLDGTLVHSLPALCHAGNNLLAEIGRSPVTEAEYAAFVGRGMRAQVQDLLSATGGIPSEGVELHLRRFLDLYAADPVSGCTAFPGVLDTLAQLSLGHAIGIATQKLEAPAWHLLNATGIGKFVTALTGGDTLDVLKPDPAMLLHTADRMGAGPILFIGDSEVDRATADNAGVPFLLYEGGYRKASVAALAPDASFSHYDILPGLVAELLGVSA